jgi:FkbM family methyltransferase
MKLRDIDVFLAHNLPGNFLKDRYARGMRRLAEYGLFRGTYDVETKYGFSMRSDRLDVVKWYAFYFGWVEPQVSKAWWNLLQPGDHVLDIGGNIGYHALLAATRVGPEGKVTTFEPSALIASQMRENILLNGLTNISVQQKAVLDRRDEVLLYFGGESSQGNSSTLKEHQADSADVSAETVEAIPFDDIIDMIDTSKLRLIKIDVEGAEQMVLSGLYANVSKIPDDVVIFVEISAQNTDNAQKMLDPFIESGFEARLIENQYTTQFLRHPGPVKFSPLRITPGVVHDVVLTKLTSNYELMETGQ